jgi:predicted transcriptional regulator
VLPDLKEIQQKRKELGLTQRELAKLTGVSRSWIAKVESGRLEPNYSKTKEVFDKLEMELKARTVKIKSLKSFTLEDIHNTKVEYAEIGER